MRARAVIAGRFACASEPSLVKGMCRWLHGYNAQTATNEEQIVVAADVTVALCSPR